MGGPRATACRPRASDAGPCGDYTTDFRAPRASEMAAPRAPATDRPTDRPNQTMSQDKPTRKGGPGQLVLEAKTKPKLKRPRLYRVLLHNDDFTPRDFVVLIIEQVFRLSETEATQLMLHVHNNGVGVAGVYPYSIAETKVAQVLAAAEQASFPLMCTMEPEDEAKE